MPESPDTSRSVSAELHVEHRLLRDHVVPSYLHEGLVDLFRNCPELASELLRACAGIDLQGRAELSTIDLSQIAPTEFRADVVVVIRDPDGVAVVGVIVEVQRDPDQRKRLTWPVYICALRARLECPVILLVLAPDPKVAKWAHELIDLGHPDFSLRPIVVSFATVPRVVEVESSSSPELLLLSAIATAELAIADAAVAVIWNLPSDRKGLYLDFLLSSLPEAIRQIVEKKMKGYQYQSEFARTYFAEGEKKGLEKGREEGREEGREAGREEGREEGREAGREEGREEGRAEGREEGRREACARVAIDIAQDKFGVDITERARTISTRLDLLQALVRALTTAGPDELANVLDRCAPGSEAKLSDAGG